MPISSFLAALRAPVINDVSTDVDNPPKFTKSKHPDVLSPAIKAAIKQHYADLKPLKVLATSHSISDIITAAKSASAESLPRSSVQAESETTLELVDVTGLMKYKDDISYRVMPSEDGEHHVVDIRSCSRVGKGDLGCNAWRIRLLMNGLKDKLMM